MTAPRKFAVIMNPSAGGGAARSAYGKCAALLSSAGCAWDLHETTRPGDARRLARDLASQSAPSMLVAAGGDGTVNEVASGILDSEASTPLGILPLGTGNDFGRLHGAISIEQAVGILARGRSRRVDAIRFQSRINGRPCTSFALLFVSSGFVGNLLKATTPSVKRVFGRRFSYSVGFLKAWLSFAASSMQVIHDSGSHSGECLLVAACNSEYAGGHGFRPAPGAIMDDGQLELLIIASQGRWRMLPRFIRVTRGTHVGLPGVHYMRITKMKLESAAGAGVQADGDLFGEPPLELEVKQRALNVLSDSPAG